VFLARIVATVGVTAAAVIAAVAVVTVVDVSGCVTTVDAAVEVGRLVKVVAAQAINELLEAAPPVGLTVTMLGLGFAAVVAVVVVVVVVVVAICSAVMQHPKPLRTRSRNRQRATNRRLPVTAAGAQPAGLLPSAARRRVR
jgi:heme exporter protein D